MTAEVGKSVARLREFRSGDLEAAYRLDQSCFEEGIAFTRGQIRDFLGREGSIALVAEREGEFAAFAIGHVAGARGHVVTIDLAAPVRGLGLGREIFTELLARMFKAGAREARLEVDVRNTNAIRFYERMGFRSRRQLPDYYGPGREGIRMTKRITQGRAGTSPAPTKSPRQV